IHLGVCNITGEKAKLLPEVSSNVRIVNFECGRVFYAIRPLKKLMNSEQYNWIVSTQTHSNIIVTFAKKF
ncbi:hypothetical protein NE645_19035, partial [Roseburia hominis]|nr:hypothetical protein [Roseburia hominis]